MVSGGDVGHRYRSGRADWIFRIWTVNHTFSYGRKQATSTLFINDIDDATNTTATLEQRKRIWTVVAVRRISARAGRAGVLAGFGCEDRAQACAWRASRGTARLPPAQRYAGATAESVCGADSDSACGG